MTPVYFGSAVNNFGVQLTLDGFLRDSVPPQPRRSGASVPPVMVAQTRADDGTPIPPDHPKFSGFIFKIQANMDPKHRDRLAFVRVCSGRFERDMYVIHTRSGRKFRLSSSQKLFGQERETVNEAWPGDIVGLVGYDAFGIGDTLTEDAAIAYNEIPRFPPEVFSFISNPTPADSKKYRAGVEQLLLEGIVQTFSLRNQPSGSTLLAAVGPLQFEVVQWRLKAEYNAESRFEPTPWTRVKWLSPHPSLAQPNSLILATGVALGADTHDRPVVFFPNDWTMRYFVEKNPGLQLNDLPPEKASSESGS
jgi:peptide chain release factor 3